MTSTRKALCVGINNFKNYPGSALQGCVNDARDMASLLQQLLGFTAADIAVLTDAQATKAAIMAQLKAMVDGAKAGKYSYLVFSLSSHGTQVPDLSGDEPDRADEVLYKLRAIVLSVRSDGLIRANEEHVVYVRGQAAQPLGQVAQAAELRVDDQHGRRAALGHLQRHLR